MSGHSKWSTIKRKKAATDAKRGKAWSKVSRDITIAARLGGTDPDGNPRLRLAIDKAKSVNMPKDNIERAIKKGSGDSDSADYEDCLYEGYGPNGVAVMAAALTDNRARTGPEVKKIFERANGNLGAANSVSWMFTQKGVIAVNREDVEEDKLMEVALESGAEDVSSSDMLFEVTCEPDVFLDVKDAIEAAGITVASGEIAQIASNNITLDLDGARKILKLIDALEDHDDVQSVASNADIPDDVAEALANEQ